MSARKLVAITGATALTLLAAIPAAVAAPGGDPGKPATDAGSTTASYIVQFTPGADRAAEVSKAKALGMEVTYVYDAVFSGMAVKANAGQATALQRNPNVVLVEADGPVTTMDQQKPTPSWGLDRVDQVSLPGDTSYTYASNGAGVTAYIVDTGINAQHEEFTGRLVAGTSSINDGNGTNDCNGHGTHVAGTVGGTKYGIAKGVKLVPVRVLDCAGSGSWAGVVAGLNWIVTNHGSEPAVANMSLGGGASSSVDTAVQAVINDGVTVAVAAGNSNQDACRTSPARVTAAVTVGATTSTDARASYSNYGSCLDLFAPGSSITSSWIGSISAINTISGTSMATPHVTGAAARILSRTGNQGLLPSAVAAALVNESTKNKVSSPGRNSPNRLLYLAPGS